MLDAFNNSRNIVKSYIPAVNAPTRIGIPDNKSISTELIDDSKPRQKRGRPIGAKDIVPRKQKLIGIAPEVAKVSEKYPRSGISS